MEKITHDEYIWPLPNGRRFHFVGDKADAEFIDAAFKDAELLAWVLAHPETAAECLDDAAAGDGTARENLERRIAGLTQATPHGRLGAA